MLEEMEEKDGKKELKKVKIEPLQKGIRPRRKEQERTGGVEIKKELRCVVFVFQLLIAHASKKKKKKDLLEWPRDK